MKVFRFLAASAFILLVQVTPAQESEVTDGLDDQFLVDDLSTGTTEMSSIKERKWDVSGFFETEGFFSAAGRRADAKSAKNNEIIKLESRASATLKYGSDFFYGLGSFDIRFYPELSHDTTSARQKDPYPDSQIEARELYVAAGDSLRFKLGKQLYQWGVADGFRVTNYLDQSDLRELFMVDSDDQNRGVWSASLKYLFNDFVIEGGLVPVHNPPLYPEKNSFWQLQTQYQGNDITIDYGSPESASYDNISGALRAGGTLGSLDFYLSYFNGIDKSILFKPQMQMNVNWVGTMPNIAPQTSVTGLTASPYYNKIETGGFDIAWVYEKLTLRAEATYTPEKWAIQKITEEQISEKVKATAPTGGSVIIDSGVQTAPFGAYVIGADYPLWGDDGRILIEFMQGKYLEDEDKLQPVYLTDLLVLRLEDKFLEKRLKLSLQAIWRPVQSEPGIMPNPEVTYDFENGLTLTAGALFFIGNNDDLLEPYEHNDTAYLRAKMNF